MTPAENSATPLPAKSALLRQGFEGLPEWRAAGRREPLQRYIDEVARSLLSDTPATPLDDDRPLVEQGFTSLLAVELGRSLEAAFQIPVPATFLYNYPSIRRIADFFLASGPDDGAPDRSATTDTQTADSAGYEFLDDLSPEELERLIKHEMDLS